MIETSSSKIEKTTMPPVRPVICTLIPRKEHRREQKIPEGVVLRLDVGALGRARDGKARGVSARDISDAEELLGAVGHHKAQDKGEHGVSVAGPTVLTLEHPAEDAVRAKADHEGKDEKAHDLEEHHADALVTAGKAANERQGDQAEHIVDERGGQNRVAHLGLELFHLLERFDCNAHGRGRQDGADEDVFDKAGALDESQLIRAPCKRRAHQERHDHAEDRDHEARLAAVLELVDVRAHAGGEHQHDDAQFAELGNKFSFCQNIQSRRTQDQARQQSAHHLRHLKQLCQKAQQLRT